MGVIRTLSKSKLSPNHYFKETLKTKIKDAFIGKASKRTYIEDEIKLHGWQPSSQRYDPVVNSKILGC